jgi:hypothetical protein
VSGEQKETIPEYFPNSGSSQVAIDLLSGRTSLRMNCEFVLHCLWDESKFPESVAETVGTRPRGLLFNESWSLSILRAEYSESANMLPRSDRHPHSLFLALPGRCRLLVLTMCLRLLAANEGKAPLQFGGEIGALRGDVHRLARFSS